jgi:hypothetical protein
LTQYRHPWAQGSSLHYRVRYDTVDRFGRVTLRYDSRQHHIGLGARHRGKAIVLFVADRTSESSTPTVNCCGTWCSIRRATTSGSQREP